MAAPTLAQSTFPNGAWSTPTPPLTWLKTDGTIVLANDTTPLPVTSTPASGSTIGLAANASTTAVTWTQATKTVTASGTPEALAASTTLCESVILEAKKARGTDNTGNVWIGVTTANDTQLLMLAPGQALELSAPAGKKIDLALIYVDVATNADGITYTAFN